MIHKMPELPYNMEEFAPNMSKETFDFHYGKHLQTYVNNLNKLISGTEFEESSLEEIICKAQGPVFNNAAQTWNHTFFFLSLSPSPSDIPSELSEKINKSFGSIDKLKEEFTKAAVSVFGSGWTWLVENSEKELKIVSTPNAGNPIKEGLKPLLVIDVWEHAYYIDYRNNRAAYIEAFWKMVDWKTVSGRL